MRSATTFPVLSAAVLVHFSLSRRMNLFCDAANEQKVVIYNKQLTFQLRLFVGGNSPPRRLSSLFLIHKQQKLNRAGNLQNFFIWNGNEVDLWLELILLIFLALVRTFYFYETEFMHCKFASYVFEVFIVGRKREQQ